MYLFNVKLLVMNIRQILIAPKRLQSSSLVLNQIIESGCVNVMSAQCGGDMVAVLGSCLLFGAICGGLSEVMGGIRLPKLVNGKWPSSK